MSGRRLLFFPSAPVRPVHGPAPERCRSDARRFRRQAVPENDVNERCRGIRLRRPLRSGDKSGQVDLGPRKDRERVRPSRKTAVASSCSKPAVARRFRASHRASASPVRNSTTGNRLSTGNATLSAKKTDKREQAAEQTDESPIAYGRNTKARPRRCRQHVLVPTAGTRRKSPRDDCKNTHRKQTDESKNPPRSTADDPLSPQRQYPPERNLIGNKSRNSHNDTYRKQTGEPSGADGKWKDSRARIRDTLS